MWDVFGWWRGRGKPERFDLFTRATLYLTSVTEPVLLFQVTDQVPAVGRAVVLGFGVAHTLLCLVAVWAGVESYLGRRDHPVRLVLATAWLTLATVGAGLLATGPARPTGSASTGLDVAVLVSCYFLAVLCTVAPPRYAALGAAGLAGVVLVVGLVDGVSVEVLFSSLVLLLCGFLLLLFAFRTSLWMLGVLWELERSRGNQVRLAVAEERLRFARDLHDVLGRNLSVVALKSELAAELAKRDRPRAVEEMLEVRRIAQDSLAEVREVVRGYRAVDLDAELAGARAVLASAGVRCRVLGEGHGLSPQAQSALGWVVREGTTNVLRHSEALTCTVSLRRGRSTAVRNGSEVGVPVPARGSEAASAPSTVPGEGLLILTMENDGVRPGGPPELGNGLLGLGERLAPLGGRVTVTRRGVDRFRLTAELPVVPPAASAPAEPGPERASAVGASEPVSAVGATEPMPAVGVTGPASVVAVTGPASAAGARGPASAGAGREPTAVVGSPPEVVVTSTATRDEACG